MIGEIYASQWAFDWFDNHPEMGLVIFLIICQVY
jgi:hypothetical protein